MSIDLQGRHLLKLLDFTPEEIKYLLLLAKKLKQEKHEGKVNKVLSGKNIILLFQKDSTRTRSAFETAGFDLGLGVTYFGPTGSQMGTKESVEDTARVLGRMYNGIQFRGFLQSDVEMLAAKSGVPVWNGLTDDWHPTQMLADFLTMMENHGNNPDNLKGKKFVFFGDARNNMGNSYLIIGAKLGLHVVSCAPKALWPKEELIKQAEEIAKQTGGSVLLTEDVKEAAKNADAIATDVWVSMGEPKEVWDKRIKLLKPYQVNMELIKATGNDKVIFLHCLPAFHDTLTETSKQIVEHNHKYLANGIEVTDEVFRSKHSKVFDEAENRQHTIKAVILATIGGSKLAKL